MRTAGNTRIVMCIIIIYMSKYRTSEIQGVGEAWPQGLCHTTLRTPSRRTVEPIAGGAVFVALKIETVTGGRTHHLSRETLDALYGNTPRQKYMHMTTGIHAQSTCDPNNNARMQQEGALKELVSASRGGPRVPLEDADVGYGIRSDSAGLQSLLVIAWGVKEEGWGPEMAQQIMGGYVKILAAEAIRNQFSPYSTCYMVLEPKEGIHFEDGLVCNSLGAFSKAEVAARVGDTSVVDPYLAEQRVSLYALEEGHRGRMCRAGMCELVVLGERVTPKEGGVEEARARHLLVEFRGIDPRGSWNKGPGRFDDKWGKVVDRYLGAGFDSSHKGEWVDEEGHLTRIGGEGGTQLTKILDFSRVVGTNIKDSHSPLDSPSQAQHLGNPRHTQSLAINSPAQET